jgi:hypothetical protein
MPSQSRIARQLPAVKRHFRRFHRLPASGGAKPPPFGVAQPCRKAEVPRRGGEGKPSPGGVAQPCRKAEGGNAVGVDG